MTSSERPIADQGDGHSDLIAQPHEPAAEGMIAQAEAVAAKISTEERPMGTPGRRFNWRAPFFVGLAGAAGVLITYGSVLLILRAGNVLILIGLALFLAVGLEPAVSFLVKHKCPRWLGVLAVLLIILGIVVGFIVAAVPALVTQGEQLAKAVPGYIKEANDHSSVIGKLNARFQIESKLSTLLSSSSSGIVSGLLGAGKVVFSALTDAFVVMVLTAYFLADMPRIRALLYRLIPHSRRPRAILIGDDILGKVGVYVLGNLAVSLIAGVLTFAWLLIFSVPYALLLSIGVALLDLIPVVGSTIAGALVAVVALTVSLPLCLATIAFFIVYRLAEDYFLVPRIIGRAVNVPALVTVVSVLIGGALLGVIGALVAIPVAAALLLLAREVLFPHLDHS